MRATWPLVTVAFVAVTASAQQVSQQAREKAEPQVIQRALAGATQLAFVSLDASAEIAKADAARDARGLPFYDRSISDDLAGALDQLKASVFPGGRMGSVVLLTEAPHRSPHVPVVTVSLRDLNALLELVQHPRVKYVHDYYKTFSPTDDGRSPDGSAGKRE